MRTTYILKEGSIHFLIGCLMEEEEIALSQYLQQELIL